jgi:hypothetical protein
MPNVSARSSQDLSAPADTVDDARLLPWPTPDGEPTCLAPDSDGESLARLADEVEHAHLHDAVIVLDHSLYVLGNDNAPETELRFVAERLAECLTNALRVWPRPGAGPQTPCTAPDAAG